MCRFFASSLLNLKVAYIVFSDLCTLPTLKLGKKFLLGKWISFKEFYKGLKSIRENSIPDYNSALFKITES